MVPDCEQNLGSSVSSYHLEERFVLFGLKFVLVLLAWDFSGTSILTSCQSNPSDFAFGSTVNLFP